MKIIRATDCAQPEKMIDAGFAIYQDIVDHLPKPFPVILLPRRRQDFKCHETLLAVNDNETEVLGIALLEEIPDVTANVSRFGDKAAGLIGAFMKAQEQGQEKPVFELGGIAVAPKAQRQGIGEAFYKAARKLSGGRCVAVVTAANLPGQKTAARAGFHLVPYAVFQAPFSIVEGKAMPDSKGLYRVVAHLCAPIAPHK